MAHCIVTEAEEILDKEYPVLDKGFVRLVDYFGGDARIVQAARVSYGAGTKTVREDAGLIDYLLRHEHTSPFEQVVLTFHLKMPIFVARQWVRHRTARMNEISGRYSVMRNEFYVPAEADVAVQSSDNKQGRSDSVVSAEYAEKVRSLLEKGQDQAYAAYSELVESGLAREIARVNLPLSLYTEMYWQCDLHNLMHFLKLRLDPHAQKEIRVYAEVLLELTRKVAPMAVQSFENHTRNGVSFSGDELDALRAVLDGKANPLTGKKLERFTAKIEHGIQL
ncbi:FAD-dependent thymidylate synthase [Treponema brennaborense]|uniref:Flavin-dependent thymidylate synthase n=1 Tax=Treponema brennaborense (strain DSM 12168 / CIP 105900 / DD5/3) TaxID=906968 RepID=F4LP51_TREBD|nr:FAD-dependent thymidylate synthase [Treponema brennaborense]AEE15927.1 Thymidylate synthase thyX [Treponema brennaborense DSM 12168]